jgi:hypothetical protein
MATVIEAVPTWTFQEAARELRVNRVALAAVARVLKVVRKEGRPLDEAGLQAVAKAMGVEVKVKYPRPA